MRLPGDLVLGGEPRAEQQRVVGSERDLDPRVKQRAQRDVGRGGGDPQGHVGRRAYFERDAGRCYPLCNAIVHGRHPVADAVGVQLVQAGPDAGRARQLAPCGTAISPRGGDPEGRGEVAAAPRRSSLDRRSR